MTEQRKTDASNYLKEVLRGVPDDMLHDTKVSLGEMILRAYLKGREDEARAHLPQN